MTDKNSCNKLVVSLIGAVILLTGCATSNPIDPLEPYNRAVFRFNSSLDKVALKPAAETYKKMPFFVQIGVSNFFGNLADVWTGMNNLLQGKFEDGSKDVVRVLANSSFGLFGLFDVASDADLPKHREDFGQTLGKWGVPPGPYVMLPVLGPSTLRDTVAMPFDMAGSPWGYVYPVSVRNVGHMVQIVDTRAGYLNATNLLEEVALDRYSFMRDGYLQRRKSQVYDGDVPRVKGSENDAYIDNEEGSK